MEENRMVQDQIIHEVNFDEYDRRMNALAEKEDEYWEDMD